MPLRKLALAALLLAPLAGAAGVSIEYQNGVVKVTGEIEREPSAGWASVFTVSTGPDAPPAFGSYSVESGALIFRPRFPFSPGMTVWARFGAATRSFNIPARSVGLSNEAPPAKVAAMYPSSPVIPDNQLKLYIVFSAPMQGDDDIFSKIHLVDSGGKPAYLPFVGQELWNREYTRLTLIFDPGRIKRGVKPNVDLGPILVEGKHYTLSIDRDLKDGSGQPLAETFRRDFAAGPSERRGIDTQQWKLSEPHAGTVEPLAGSSSDRAASTHCAAQETVSRYPWRAPASFSTSGSHEMSWTFQPDQPWKAGDYNKLAIDMAPRRPRRQQHRPPVRRRHHDQSGPPHLGSDHLPDLPRALAALGTAGSWPHPLGVRLPSVPGYQVIKRVVRLHVVFWRTIRYAPQHGRTRVALLNLRVWADTIRTNTTAQDLIEYALMAGFVSVTTGALMPGAAANISRIFSSVTSVLFNAKNQGS